jgi:hypothetical protein
MAGAAKPSNWGTWATSYLPTALADKYYFGNPTAEDDARLSSVTCVSLVQANGEDPQASTHIFVCVGQKSGFHVWSLNVDMTDKPRLVQCDENMKGVRCLAPLANPSRSSFPQTDRDNSAPPSAHAFKRPLMAVVAQSKVLAAEDSGTADGEDRGQALGISNTVHLLSLDTLQYVHVLKLPEEVVAVTSNSAHVAVVTIKAVYIFDALTFENTCVIICDARDAPSIVPIALGSRWLAVSGVSTKSFDRKVGARAATPKRPQQDFTVMGNDWSLVSGARGLEVGVDFLGKVGSAALTLTQETVGKYMGEGKQGTTEALRIDGENSVNKTLQKDALETSHGPHGHEVLILDLKPKPLPANQSESSLNRRCRPLAHFPAYVQGQGVAALAWSPSGDMLATAPEDGRTASVYSIFPAIDGTLARQLLYKYQRGLTRAVVTGLQFSPDCKWMRVSTTRGTDHLFALNRPKVTSVTTDNGDGTVASENVIETIQPTVATHCANGGFGANGAIPRSTAVEEAPAGGLFSTSPIAIGNYLLGIKPNKEALSNESPASAMPAYLQDLRQRNSNQNTEQYRSNTITQNSVARVYHKAESEKYLQDYQAPSSATSYDGSRGAPGQGCEVEMVRNSGSTILTQNRKKNLMVIYLSPDAILNWSYLNVRQSSPSDLSLSAVVFDGGAKRVPLTFQKGKITPVQPTPKRASRKKSSDISEELLANAEMNTHVPRVSHNQGLPLWALPKFNIRLMKNSGLTKKSSGSYAIPWWWKCPINSKPIKQTQLGPLPQNVVPLPAPSAPMFEMDNSEPFEKVLIGRVRDAKSSDIFAPVN